MGEIRIRDESGEEQFVTGHLDDEIELRIRDGRPQVVVPEDGGLSPTDVAVVEESVEAGRSGLVDSPWWFLYVPTVVGAALATARWLEPFEALLPGVGAAFAAGVGAFFLLTAATGTALVVVDAQELRAGGGDWRPAVWSYVAGGGVVTTAFLLASAGPLPGGWAVLPVVFGAALVGGATSSAVSGPVYLHRRRRRVGLD